MKSYEEIADEYFQDIHDLKSHKDIIIRPHEYKEIAERYAQQRVNEVLDEAANVVNGDVYEKSEVIEEILKLKKNE